MGNKQSSRNASAAKPAAKTVPAGIDPRGSTPPPAPASKAPGSSSSGEDIQPRSKRARTEETVTVQCPKAFRLNTHDGVVEYPSGIYEMPRSHAEHWYAQAHDVEIK